MRQNACVLLLYLYNVTYRKQLLGVKMTCYHVSTKNLLITYLYGIDGKVISTVAMYKNDYVTGSNEITFIPHGE